MGKIVGYCRVFSLGKIIVSSSVSATFGQDFAINTGSDMTETVGEIISLAFRFVRQSMTLEMPVLDEVVADGAKKGAQLVARGVRGYSHMISANFGT